MLHKITRVCKAHLKPELPIYDNYTRTHTRTHTHTHTPHTHNTHTHTYIYIYIQLFGYQAIELYI